MPKYIRFSNDQFILFTSDFTHKKIASRFKSLCDINAEPASAGFAHYRDDSRYGASFSCYGNSETMGIDCSEQDGEKLENFVRKNGMKFYSLYSGSMLFIPIQNNTIWVEKFMSGDIDVKEHGQILIRHKAITLARSYDTNITQIVNILQS